MEIRKLKFIFEVWFAFWPGLVFFFGGVGTTGKCRQACMATPFVTVAIFVFYSSRPPVFA